MEQKRDKLQLKLPRDRKDFAAIDEMLARNSITAALSNRTVFSTHPTVMILSDYSGDAGGCDYSTYSFLFVGWSNLQEWHSSTSHLRSTVLGTRIMEYKKLKDKRRQEALPEWLLLADAMHGFLITVAVHKRVRLFNVDGSTLSDALASEGFGNWPNATAERMARIVHFLWFFARYMVVESSKLFWKTDEDSIAGSGSASARREQLGQLFIRIGNLYLPHAIKQVGYAVDKAVDSPDRMLEHALSLPDLAAGALADSFSPSRYENVQRYGREQVLYWLARSSVNLRKYIIRVDYAGVEKDNRTMYMTQLVELHVD